MIALSAKSKGAPLERTELKLSALKPDEVRIAVEYCGVCHSDLSMLDNEWGMTAYPFVPGHEVVGRVEELGEFVSNLRKGDRVGLGWYSRSCQSCPQCVGGSQNLCLTPEQTIIGRQGGFATHVQCQAAWALKLPDGLAPESSGPLFCGGITVFNPIVQLDVRPTDRVGVIGIGGLGHLAVKFLRAWGCEVVAFTSSAAKRDEALALGAHRTIDSKDPAEVGRIKGTLDFIISTANADLDWNAYLSALGPRGRLHFVGVVPSPIPAPAFTLIAGQKSLSGSPLGSPATCMKMLEFCERHNIAPTIERFPMSEANAAFDRLRSGKARYRIVLQNDLSAK